MQRRQHWRVEARGRCSCTTTTGCATCRLYNATCNAASFRRIRQCSDRIMAQCCIMDCGRTPKVAPLPLPNMPINVTLARVHLQVHNSCFLVGEGALPASTLISHPAVHRATHLLHFGLRPNISLQSFPVQVHNSCFFAGAAALPATTLISNPPYIAAPDDDILMPALHGGSDGADLTRVSNQCR